MLLGVIKNDIEFDYRPDDPHAASIYAVLYKGEIVELTHPRIAYFDTTFYSGEITEGPHKGVVLNISEDDVEIIDTAWKKIK